MEKRGNIIWPSCVGAQKMFQISVDFYSNQTFLADMVLLFLLVLFLVLRVP